MWLDEVGALMAQKFHDLVFVSAGTPGLDLTWSPSQGVMMIMMNYAVARGGASFSFTSSF